MFFESSTRRQVSSKSDVFSNIYHVRSSIMSFTVNKKTNKYQLEFVNKHVYKNAGFPYSLKSTIFNNNFRNLNSKTKYHRFSQITLKYLYIYIYVCVLQNFYITLFRVHECTTKLFNSYLYICLHQRRIWCLNIKSRIVKFLRCYRDIYIYPKISNCMIKTYKNSFKVFYIFRFKMQFRWAHEKEKKNITEFLKQKYLFTFRMHRNI